ncbi:hypothetical protein [Pseudomonas fluorescens]|uniref:Uncharacterized protein n=1 Tax=Pseudomonas fluorescens TaxID=294 RepID=A0A5E7SKR3_PSEFL|nr:hypothetical protein [Pseudomonas fluorescens]VVP86428.1 hypothetical protein PS941_01244 [Pseudomonas fluorescens]
MNSKLVDAIEELPAETIKGTITHRGTGTEHSFNATFIYRDERQGSLYFHGVMDDREQIMLQLSESQEPSGTINLPDSRVLYLVYRRKFRDTTHWDVFASLSGSILLQRQPENAINGRLHFTTEKNDGNDYVIDVVFALSA